MAELAGEFITSKQVFDKEARAQDKTDDKSPRTFSSGTENLSDIRIDFREDQEQGPSDMGFFYRGSNGMSQSSGMGISGFRGSGYDPRNVDMYNVDGDGYYNRFGDSSKRPSLYDSYCDEHIHVHSPTSDYDLLSPRSRYDLACSPHQSRNSSQWDHREEYGSPYEYQSPRYKTDPIRWADHDNRFSLYDEQDTLSPPERMGYSSRYPSDLDSYPSSYTYGMRLPRSNQPSSYAMNMRLSDRSDVVFSDEGYERYSSIDRHGYPFSDPSSPQPMYNSNGYIPSTVNRPFTKLQSISRVNQTPSPAPASQSKNFGNTATSSVENQISPISPTTPVSHVTPMDESGDKDDENYKIDSKKIMQNLEERTVVLIRNIPNRYKLEDLQQVISTYVDEEYTVLRLPIDAFTKRNLGYAFVNFSDSHEVLKLYIKMNGQRWPKSNSLKKFYMCFAKKQNYVIYENPIENAPSFL